MWISCKVADLTASESVPSKLCGVDHDSAGIFALAKDDPTLKDVYAVDAKNMILG